MEAGASIAHAHVRNDDETPSSDPEKFARLLEGLRKHCPGLIVQFSTGGRSGAGRERGGMLSLRPDMASLSVGSNNFPTRVYENSPELVDWLAAEMLTYGVKPEIEAFDLSHIFRRPRWRRTGASPRRSMSSSSWACRTRCRSIARSSTSTSRRSSALRPTQSGAGPGSGRTRSSSTSGASPPADTRGPAWRTTSASTGPLSPPRTPRWSGASSSSARSTNAPSRHRPRRAGSSI